MVPNNPYAAPEANESPCLEHVLYFVWEREAIRIAKENGYAGELTKDVILKQYRFCNIRRRDDLVSKWIIENMLVHADPNEDDIWFIAAIARYVNWPPMLHKLLSEGLVPGRVDDFDYEAFGNCIDETTRAGDKAWSGAYMTFPCKKEPGQPKGIATAKHILAPLAERAEDVRRAVKTNSVEAVFKALHGGYGWQDFMCGQVVADLTYTPQLENAVDLYTWAPIGPGSSKGIARLAGINLTQRWFQEDFNRRMIKIQDLIIEHLDISNLTLHDVQNVMCEMDKYWRVLYGEGRPRTIYKPETAF